MELGAAALATTFRASISKMDVLAQGSSTNGNKTDSRRIDDPRLSSALIRPTFISPVVSASKVCAHLRIEVASLCRACWSRIRMAADSS